MEKELSYLSPEGFTVFTSQFLKNRGTCCKTSCLHCPFGFTLKKCGLQFDVATDSDHELIENIIQQSGTSPVDWRAFMPSNVCIVKIKGEVCGIMFKNHIVVKHIYLKKNYQNQGLSKEMIESYYFI